MEVGTKVIYYVRVAECNVHNNLRNTRKRFENFGFANRILRVLYELDNIHVHICS